MFVRKTVFLAGLLLGVICTISQAQKGPVSMTPGWEESEEKGRMHILLLGDSTVEGSVPRAIEPEADHLEGIVRKLLDGEGDLPPVRVTNEGVSGEFVKGLLDKRYEQIVETHPKADYVTIRYGLNDSRKREDFETNFPLDLKNLIANLREDYPEAKVFLETVIVYFDEERSEKINHLIREVAASESVPLIDMWAKTKAEIDAGNTALTYHRLKREAIPDKFAALLPEPWKEGEICVLDNRLDVHFRDIPGWFADKHPNLAGYHVIGSELARVFSAEIRQRLEKNE